MCKRRFCLRVPNWHPARLNQLLNAHWSKRALLKRYDANVVALAVMGAGVPAANGPRRVSLEIVLGTRQRGGDPDAYWKSLLDALVKCGALKDDSRFWCQMGSVTFRRGKMPGSIIILEEIKDHGD